MYIVGESVDDVLEQLITFIMLHGKYAAPRNIEITESIGVIIELRNPRRRIQYNPARNLNVHFALGEFLWYFSGDNLLENITYYNRRYGDYSDDNFILNGAYGKRIFGFDTHKNSQWQTIKKIFDKDIYTRQGVISIFSPNDIIIKTKDVPCTCSLQFFVREGKLDMIVYMRSNDLIWGTPYDIFSFTMFQEILANELNVELGKYIHFIGSAHIYSYHNKLCQNILKVKEYEKKEMPPLDIYSDEHILEIVECAKLIRKGEKIDILPKTKTGQGIVAFLIDYAQHKKGYKEENFTNDIPDYFNIEKI